MPARRRFRDAASRAHGAPQAGSHMAFVQFTQPDDQPIVINTERIITAALWLLGVPIPIIILLALLHHN